MCKGGKKNILICVSTNCDVQCIVQFINPTNLRCNIILGYS